MLTRIIVITLAALQLSCGGPIYEQVFHGKILEEGRPVSGLPLRAGLAMAQGDCSGDFAEGFTDESGSFDLRKPYVPGIAEFVAVVVHEHYLCALIDGSFTPIWKLQTGPAISDIRIECDLRENQSPSVLCMPENQAGPAAAASVH